MCARMRISNGPLRVADRCAIFMQLGHFIGVVMLLTEREVRSNVVQILGTSCVAGGHCRWRVWH